MLLPTLPSRTQQARRGATVVWVLFSLSTLLTVAAVAIDHTLLWEARTELQVSADAAALAAADTLVDDDLLRGDPAYLPGLLNRSATAANNYAGMNPVLGRPYKLVPNPNNFIEGDLVFGTVDTPRSRDFAAAVDAQNPANADLAKINIAHIAGRLTRARGNTPRLFLGGLVLMPDAEVRAEAAATLDRDVIGFRPMGQHPLLIAPLGLLCDYSATDANSWQYQVEAKKGQDVYRFDRTAGAFVSDPGGDGLFEFNAALALGSNPAPDANVALLQLGVNDANGAADQLLNGITVDQLSALGGQLVLNASDNRLSVPGGLQGPDSGDPALDALVQALDQLRSTAAVRVWPLYCGVDGGTGQPILCGFVAARVVTVTAPSSGSDPLRFTLQPTMVSMPPAVTDASQRGVGGVPITNPYVCKVRLVE